MVDARLAAHDERMHFLSQARAQAGITVFSLFVALAALGAPPSFAAELVPTLSHTVPAHQDVSSGIIMRDGGICDPIRHMGC